MKSPLLIPKRGNTASMSTRKKGFEGKNTNVEVTKRADCLNAGRGESSTTSFISTLNREEKYLLAARAGQEEKGNPMASKREDGPGKRVQGGTTGMSG